jgi:hypothetical protein
MKPTFSSQGNKTSVFIKDHKGSIVIDDKGVRFEMFQDSNKKKKSDEKPTKKKKSKT